MVCLLNISGSPRGILGIFSDLIQMWMCWCAGADLYSKISSPKGQIWNHFQPHSSRFLRNWVNICGGGEMVERPRASQWVGGHQTGKMGERYTAFTEPVKKILSGFFPFFLNGKSFGLKQLSGTEGYPPFPLTEKIRSVVFDGLPYVKTFSSHGYTWHNFSVDMIFRI